MTRRQAVELDKRFEAARFIYNAALGEMLRRLDLMRQSRTWQKARRCRSSKVSKLFRTAGDQHGFNRFEAIDYARQLVRNGFGRDRLNINDADCLGKRAFNAVSRVAVGKAKRVRFKGANRLRSLEADGPGGGIRYRDGVLIWRDLRLPIVNSHIGGRHGARVTERYVLDAYAILALVGDEPGGARVAESLAAEGAEFVSSAINVGEMSYIVRRRRSAEAALRIEAALYEHPRVSEAAATRERIRAAAEIRADEGLSLADAFAPALALEVGGPLVTGDAEFRRLRDSRGLRVWWPGAASAEH